MGFAAYDMRCLLSLKNEGRVNHLKKVFDIGAQQLYCQGAEAEVCEFLRAFGVQKSPKSDEIRSLCNLGYARELWGMLGIEYASLDTSLEAGALNLDLNFDSVPMSHRKQYDLVLNLGTTEHVCNQLNAFRFIHDLTNVGGVMFHSLPFSGYQNHGLVNYNPRFFWMLMRGNDYKYLDLDMSFSDQRQGLHPDIVADVLKFKHAPPDQNVFQTFDGGLRCSMRRNNDAAFVPPFDGIVDNDPLAVPEGYRSTISSWRRLRVVASRFKTKAKSYLRRSA